MKRGDKVQTPEGKGKIVEIQGGGKVAVVKVKDKTVYVRLPEEKREDDGR